jgi:hypothetical protein
MTLGTRLKELRSNEDTSNAGTKWTIDEDKNLVQEIVDDKSYEEIALEHKRTILSIKSRVISHIIYPKYKDDIENNIENYNSIINHEIINKINTFNIYDKYNENIKKSYNIYSNINHIEFKNILINKIKSIKLKINRENKEKIINLILQYINIELFNYINKSTNITLDSEIYFIYLSNINSLLNKIKKDILDNYNDQLLINIDNIINDQYHNIQSIIENILDKYYLLNI